MVNIDITFQVVSFTFLRYISSHKKLGSFRNPSHTVVTTFSGIRNMKQSLQSRFLHSVAPYLSSGILPPTDYRATIKWLLLRYQQDYVNGLDFKYKYPSVIRNVYHILDLVSLLLITTLILKFGLLITVNKSVAFM